MVQIVVALALMAGIAALTIWLTRRGDAVHDGSARDVYLASGKLNWLYIAGSITLTNLSTEQLVGMNGNQMFLLAWWELSGFVGLLILAFVFVPVYYRHKCTTVTQLLEQRYGGGSIRTLISGIFLVGNILIYLPAALYSGSLFLKSMLGVDWPLWWFAAPMAVIAAMYTILGGLKAVAVMDTISGIGVLAIALLVVFLALNEVGWDLSGVPSERTTMVGAADSPIPFHTLFTGMLFIQIFYWSTNQNITQKAMAAPTVREAQKGVIAASVVRILIVPAIVVIPGVVSYKLMGDVGDASYGRIVAQVLPQWLAGGFAAMMAAAVIGHTAAILNSSVALYDVDFHSRFIRPVANHWRLAASVSAVLTVTSILMVPAFEGAQSIINLLQQLNGLASMPILSAFIVGLLFSGVRPSAAIVGVLWGIAFYGAYTFWWQPTEMIGLHYIDFMVLTLATSVVAALAFNRLALGARAEWIGLRLFRGTAPVGHAEEAA